MMTMRALLLLALSALGAFATNASTLVNTDGSSADAAWKAAVLAAITGMRVEFDGLRGEFDGFRVEVGAKVDAKFDALNAKVDAKFDALNVKVDDLADSVVTPAVGARLEACGSTVVVAAFVFETARPTIFFQQCTAVPLPASASAAAAAGAPPPNTSSTLFLTSAHCFFNSTILVGGPTTVSFDGATFSCGLAMHFFEFEPDVQMPGAQTLGSRTPQYAPDSLDLAVLRCASSVPIAPTRVSTMPHAAHTPAVIVGYTRGEHLEPSKTARLVGEAGRFTTYALHVKVSRLSSSFQTPAGKGVNDTGTMAAARGFVEDTLPPLVYVPSSGGSDSVGFVDLSPWNGMSGGAIVDTRCGLFGVTEMRSVHALGGQFVRLLPAVLERVARAVAAVPS